MSENSTPNIVIKDFNELGFGVRAEVHSHYVDFKIYERYGEEMDGTPLYCQDVSGVNVCTSDIDAADVFAHGGVKWDGCSNWWFDFQDQDIMHHECDRSGLENIGKILAACWDMAGELCENADPVFSRVLP